MRRIKLEAIRKSKIIIAKAEKIFLKYNILSEKPFENFR